MVLYPPTAPILYCLLKLLALLFTVSGYNPTLYQTMKQQFIRILCDFIHAAQKERGYVYLYLRNHKDVAANLEKQFSIVDGYIKLLALLAKKKNPKIELLLNVVRHLAVKRKYMIARILGHAEALAFYTRDIIAPTIDIVQEMAVFDQSNHPARVSAFINFLHWKERVGLERALGGDLLNLDWSDAIDFKSRMEHIISEQQAYERMFLTLADNQARKAIEDLEIGNNIFQKIQNINHGFSKRSVERTVQSITPQEWFDLFSAKMDLLHEVGKMIVDNLAADKDIKPTAKLVSDMPKEAVMEKGVRAYRDTIQALPLFCGLDEGKLQDILKYARVISHHKGTIVFMQGEQASRFYIVLEGWVKLFKGNVSGQESVLQVLTVGETLLETTIFNNLPFPVSAQAVDNVKLLSIPASIVREQLQNNKKLAINMLSNVAGRSQALITQFEQLTLKTVPQRIGWFLLKLFLENGESTKNLKLPYDKSLIAGFLGMKPETFSRTLQQLKEQGIDINHKSVDLLDVFALCDYCDMELAAKCRRAGSGECPNPNLCK